MLHCRPCELHLVIGLCLLSLVAVAMDVFLLHSSTVLAQTAGTYWVDPIDVGPTGTTVPRNVMALSCFAGGNGKAQCFVATR
jgi:hypothetical protein